MEDEGEETRSADATPGRGSVKYPPSCCAARLSRPAESASSSSAVGLFVAVRPSVDGRRDDVDVVRLIKKSQP